MGKDGRVEGFDSVGGFLSQRVIQIAQDLLWENGGHGISIALIVRSLDSTLHIAIRCGWKGFLSQRVIHIAQD